MVVYVKRYTIDEVLAIRPGAAKTVRLAVEERAWEGVPEEVEDYGVDTEVVVDGADILVQFVR